jgi:CheY-like chemotaxis protein
MSKVLYAEDEFTNRKLIEVLLQREGIDCDLAADGFAALDMFQHNDYSVVILDHYMPGLNGMEVARKIRAIDGSVPLIALTGDDSQVPDLERAGFNRVFIKPLRGDDYIGAITRYT